MNMGIYPLKGKIQHYAWGGYDFIPDLLGVNERSHPSAEYWMGIHPNAPSFVELPDGTLEPLNLFIVKQGASFLGEWVQERFGQLPYLFKVLDVKDMLSIQVHPTRPAAALGFKLENEAGIALSDPARNYKDDNHKPEVMIALSDFWLLHGFKPAYQIDQWLHEHPELHTLARKFQGGDYRSLYEYVMTMSSSMASEILSSLLQKARDQYLAGDLSKADPSFWAARALNTFCKGSIAQIDKGIFSIYLFNLVHLSPGEGIFQAAGVPHAYLEGQCMELMSNSDNVLRGGLTPKHVDVPELMKHTHFEAVEPSILQTQPDVQQESFIFPVPDFGIGRLHVVGGGTYRGTCDSVEIWFCTEGNGILSEGEKKLTYHKGQAFILSAGVSYQLNCDASTVFFRAFVPDTAG